MLLHHRLKIEIHISCDGVVVSIYPILSNFVEHFEAVGPSEGSFKALLLLTHHTHDSSHSNSSLGWGICNFGSNDQRADYRLSPPGVGFSLAMMVRIFTMGPSNQPSSVLRKKHVHIGGQDVGPAPAVVVDDDLLCPGLPDLAFKRFQVRRTFQHLLTKM